MNAGLPQGFDDHIAEADGHYAAQRLNDALATYTRCHALRPSDAQIMKKIGNCHVGLGQLDLAANWYRKAVDAEPGFFEGAYNLGWVAMNQGRPDEALEWYRKALDIDPRSYDAWNNLGMLYFNGGQFELAEDSFAKALTINSQGFEALVNRGNALCELGRFMEAAQVQKQALSIRPGVAELHYNLARTLLTLGQIKEGFEEYEWRLKLPAYAPPECGRPLWDGSTLPQGTLLLYTERGAGETIQFVRYCREAARRVGRLVVVTDASLQRLLASVPGVDQVLVEGRDPLPDFDAFHSIMSLPALLKTSVTSIPVRVPYLAGPASVGNALATGRGLKVGVVWAGKHSRFMPFSAFAQLFDVPGVSFYSLQPEVGRQRADVLPENVADLAGAQGDMADMAAVIKQLDLLISVDADAAHLAGALGQKVWVLLSLVADWRWGMFADKTPWYPSMTLFRQRRRDDWQSVIARVKDQLAIMAAKKR